MLYLQVVVSWTRIQISIRIGQKMTELWAKNHMPIYGHTHEIWYISAHELVKY